MNFNPSIDVSTIIAVLGMAGAIFYFVVNLRADFGVMVEQLKAIKNDMARLEGVALNFDQRLQKIAEVMVIVARQEERLNAGDVRQNGLRGNLDAINDRVTALERYRGNDKTPGKLRRA